MLRHQGPVLPVSKYVKASGVSVLSTQRLGVQCGAVAKSERREGMGVCGDTILLVFRIASRFLSDTMLTCVVLAISYHPLPVVFDSASGAK
jgi:hypothetical protein